MNSRATYHICHYCSNREKCKNPQRDIGDCFQCGEFENNNKPKEENNG